jgi:hypothetical protein
MNTDELLRETFRDLEDGANGLDPARVIAGARRRRRVRRIATSATASATLAATVVTALAMYPPNDEPPVAGWSATDSLPVIENRNWTQLAGRPQWFYIDGLSWKLGDPPGTREWTGVSEALPEDAADGTWHPVVSGVGNYWSTFIFLPADVTRVKYRVRGKAKTLEIEAHVFRLESAPEWVLAFADYPDTVGSGPDITVTAFDAAGKLVIRCEPPRQTDKSAPPEPACRRVG